MKRMLQPCLATFLVLCLSFALVLPAAAQTPVATADPFALPANLRILRIHAGNGFDYLRTDDGGLAYANADLVDDGLSRVPVPQWLEDWYTDMRVLDHYVTYVVMVPDAPAGTTGVTVDIRLLSFPDSTAANAAVPASFDLLLRQAAEIPDASQDLTLLDDVPEHEQAIIGVTGTDPSLDIETGAQGVVGIPFSRFIAQHDAMVASVKVTSSDPMFNDAVARELLDAQLGCLTVNAFCQPVPIPSGITYDPATPVASPAGVRPGSRSRDG